MAASDDTMKVRAQAKWVRMSARKARLVLDHIRGRDANTKLTAVGLELDAKNKVLLLKSQVKGNYVPPRK